MKAIFCKECKFNKNGWCYKYECNGKKRTELCYKYKDGVTIQIEQFQNRRDADIEEIAKMLKDIIKFENNKGDK